MSDPVSYRFLSTWPVAASPEAAYAALYEVEDYPKWWPEVREARKINDNCLWMRTRATLPYDLTFTLNREVADTEKGLLVARLEGDLEGRIVWTIVPTSTGSLITFDERVVTNLELLNRFAPVARPAFIANHALMMRSGHSGLRVFLAGYRLGASKAGSSR